MLRAAGRSISIELHLDSVRSSASTYNWQTLRWWKLHHHLLFSLIQFRRRHPDVARCTRRNQLQIIADTVSLFFPSSKVRKFMWLQRVGDTRSGSSPKRSSTLCLPFNRLERWKSLECVLPPVVFLCNVHQATSPVLCRAEDGDGHQASQQWLYFGSFSISVSLRSRQRGNYVSPAQSLFWDPPNFGCRRF